MLLQATPEFRGAEGVPCNDELGGTDEPTRMKAT